MPACLHLSSSLLLTTISQTVFRVKTVRHRCHRVSLGLLTPTPTKLPSLEEAGMLMLSQAISLSDEASSSSVIGLSGPTDAEARLNRVVQQYAHIREWCSQNCACYPRLDGRYNAGPIALQCLTDTL